MSTGTTRRRRSWARSRGGAGLVVALAFFAAVAHSEDDRAVDDLPPVVQQNQKVHRADLGKDFDQTVFQQDGDGFSPHSGFSRSSPAADAGAQQPESPTLRVAGKLADDRLARIDAVCDLTDDQRRKLRLAMESDIRRLAEEIDATRQSYQGVQVNFNDPAGQRKWQQFRQDTQRFLQRLQNPFDSESLLAKVLPTTLDSEQYGRLTGEIAARRSSRWRGFVAAAMHTFDDLLGLDQRQHEEIEKLLLEREPALRVEGPANRRTGNILVAVVLSEIDPQRLQGIVSERQWQTLARVADRGKAMRFSVEAQGVLENTSQ